MSVVTKGPLAGKTLKELIKSMGKDLLGSRAPEGEFPLLIKLIDSKQSLSVQVHPSDETAARFGGEAKTEMWYALDADDGAQVYAGLKRGTDAKAFKKAMEEDTLKDILGVVPISKGEAVFIPGGRVHAIDAGCLLLEVQQNSNTTYRIYDWGRVGSDGKPRDLHVEQALKVIEWNDQDDPKVIPKPIESADGNEWYEILVTSYFRLERVVLTRDGSQAGDPGTFQILFVSEGVVALDWESGTDILTAGSTCMIPAALPAYRVVPKGESAQILRITLP